MELTAARMASRVPGGRRDQHFDVGAIALLAMAVGHEPQFPVRRKASQNLGHGIARDLELRNAIDLPPHRARAVHHDNGPVGGAQTRGREQQGDEGDNRFERIFHVLHSQDQVFDSEKLPIAKTNSIG